MTSTRTATLVEALAARSDAGISNSVRATAVLFLTVLTAAAAQVSIPVPFSPVPFTFQPTVVLLGGLVLGGPLGAVSQMLYLAAGVAGLPVFAASATLPPGALRLLGPTGGYLMAYPIAAFVVGTLARRGFDRRYLSTVLAMGIGLLIIYTCGTLWLASFTARITASSSLAAAFAAGVAPFVLADIVKLAAAAGIVPGLWRLLGTRP